MPCGMAHHGGGGGDAAAAGGRGHCCGAAAAVLEVAGCFGCDCPGLLPPSKANRFSAPKESDAGDEDCTCPDVDTGFEDADVETWVASTAFVGVEELETAFETGGQAVSAEPRLPQPPAAASAGAVG